MKFIRIKEKFRRNYFFRFIFFKIFKVKLEFSNEDITPFYIYSKEEQPYLHYFTNDFEDEINFYFNKWHTSGEFEYIIKYPSGCYIEPNSGWALTIENKVIQKSLPYGETGGIPLPHYILYKKKKVVKIETAISIYYNWFNYWHFYNDVLGQLYVLDKMKIDNTIPIIIPRKALNLKYVSELFEQSEYFKKRKWYFQDMDTYVFVNNIYFCKAIPNIKDQFVYFSQIFKPLSLSKTHSNLRIFLKRNKNRGRYLINQNEIEQEAIKQGFACVDTDEMTLAEQIDLFSNTITLIAIHGAGITNMVYRYPQKLNLIEIFPSNFINGHYYYFAKELDFNYYPITGSNEIERSFHMDILEFSEKIKQF